MAERRGCPVLLSLWSYVIVCEPHDLYCHRCQLCQSPLPFVISFWAPSLLPLQAYNGIQISSEEGARLLGRRLFDLRAGATESTNKTGDVHGIPAMAAVPVQSSFHTGPRTPACAHIAPFPPKLSLTHENIQCPPALRLRDQRKIGETAAVRLSRTTFLKLELQTRFANSIATIEGFIGAQYGQPPQNLNRVTGWRCIGHQVYSWRTIHFRHHGFQKASICRVADSAETATRILITSRRFC